MLALPVNEECGFTGARAMCDLWRPDRQTTAQVTGGTITAAELFPRPPDLAIVAEPTELQVVVVHQGVVRWRCHAIGRAAHSSRPDEGINAVYAMGRVAHAIELYQRELAAAEPHPLCGRPAVCVTTIAGGVGINTVPEVVTISVDRRIGPGESPSAAFADLVRYIAQHANAGVARIEHDPPFMKSSGLDNSNNGPVAARLVQLVRDARAQMRAGRRSLWH